MSRIEAATIIAIMIAAVAVAGNNIYSRLVAPMATNDVASETAHRLAGKPLLLPASLPVGRRGTITLFVSKDCHFCRESMDSYRELAAVASEDGCDVKVRAVGPEAREKREDLVSYLADRKLGVDGVDVANFATLGISSTPTLVLEDSSGLVRNVWLSLLPATRQKEVISRVKFLCR